MAGRLIAMKNSVQQVKGDVEVADWKEWLRLDSVSFVATSYANTESETSSVHQSAVSMVLPFGPWVAELQQRLYHGTMLGDVELVELEQKLDAANTKSWKKIREVSLLDAWVSGFSHAWTGIAANVQLMVEYTDMTLACADKVAHFSRTDMPGK